MDAPTRDALTKAESASRLKEAAETVAHLRAKLSTAERALAEYREAAGRRRALEATIVEAVRAADPYPRIPIIPRGTESPYPMAAVADLSDLHIGEVVQPAETEDWGAYNWAIAQARLFKYSEKLVGWVAMHRHSFIVDDLYILGKGDYVSGGIHDELAQTNEFPPPVQAVNAGTAIGEFLLRLAPHFKNVIFVGVGADNHGRLTRKPRAKLKASDNYSYVVHAIAQKYASHVSNLQFLLADGMKWVQEIAEHRFLIEHGDTIKMWMGIPHYGIERSKAREASRRMGSPSREFDYYSIGHFHTPCVNGNILINGSLSGTSEFDHACGRLSHPSQCSYLVHPRYGIFDWTPWTLGEVKSGTEETNGSRPKGLERTSRRRSVKQQAAELVHDSGLR